MLVATAVVLTAANAFAQAKTNFAGTWVREAPAGGGGGAAGGGGGNRGGGGGGGGFGTEPTITQTASAITIKWMGGGQQPTEQVRTYNLTGESKNKAMGRGGETEEVTKASWDGAKLVLVTALANGERKQVLSIEGGNLVVEQTQPGRGEGAAPATTKITYKKKA
jgi:predicted secreted Zn-dependent protease